MNGTGMSMPFDSWVSLMIIKNGRKAIIPAAKMLVRFGDKRSVEEIISTTDERYDELEQIVLDGVRRQNRR